MREEQKNIGNFIEKYLKEDGESEYKEIIKRYEKEEGKSEEEFWEEMKKYAEEVMREKEISEDELAKIAGGVKFGELGKKGKQMVSYLLVASSMLGQTGGMKASAVMPKQGIDIIKDGKNKEIKFFKEKPKVAIAAAAAAVGTTVAGAAGIGAGIYFLGKKLLAGTATGESSNSPTIFGGTVESKSESSEVFSVHETTDDDKSETAIGLIVSKDTIGVLGNNAGIKEFIKENQDEIFSLNEGDVKTFGYGSKCKIIVGKAPDNFIATDKDSLENLVEVYVTIASQAIRNNKKHLFIGIPENLYSNEDEKELISYAISIGLESISKLYKDKNIEITIVSSNSESKKEEQTSVEGSEHSTGKDHKSEDYVIVKKENIEVENLTDRNDYPEDAWINNGVKCQLDNIKDPDESKLLEKLDAYIDLEDESTEDESIENKLIYAEKDGRLAFAAIISSNFNPKNEKSLKALAKTYASLVSCALKNGRKYLVIGVPEILYWLFYYHSSSTANKIIPAVLDGIEAGFKNVESFTQEQQEEGIKIVLNNWPEFQKEATTTSSSSDETDNNDIENSDKQHSDEAPEEAGHGGESSHQQENIGSMEEISEEIDNYYTTNKEIFGNVDNNSLKQKYQTKEGLQKIKNQLDIRKDFVEQIANEDGKSLPEWSSNLLEYFDLTEEETLDKTLNDYNTYNGLFEQVYYSKEYVEDIFDIIKDQKLKEESIRNYLENISDITSIIDGTKDLLTKEDLDELPKIAKNFLNDNSKFNKEEFSDKIKQFEAEVDKKSGNKAFKESLLNYAPNDKYNIFGSNSIYQKVRNVTNEKTQKAILEECKRRQEFLNTNFNSNEVYPWIIAIFQEKNLSETQVGTETAKEELSRVNLVRKKFEDNCKDIIGDSSASLEFLNAIQNSKDLGQLNDKLNRYEEKIKNIKTLLDKLNSDECKLENSEKESIRETIRNNFKNNFNYDELFEKIVEKKEETGFSEKELELFRGKLEKFENVPGEILGNVTVDEIVEAVSSGKIDMTYVLEELETRKHLIYEGFSEKFKASNTVEVNSYEVYGWLKKSFRNASLLDKKYIDQVASRKNIETCKIWLNFAKDHKVYVYSIESDFEMKIYGYIDFEDLKNVIEKYIEEIENRKNMFLYYSIFNKEYNDFEEFKEDDGFKEGLLNCGKEIKDIIAERNVDEPIEEVAVDVLKKIYQCDNKPNNEIENELKEALKEDLSNIYETSDNYLYEDDLIFNKEKSFEAIDNMSLKDLLINKICMKWNLFKLQEFCTKLKHGRDGKEYYNLSRNVYYVFSTIKQLKDSSIFDVENKLSNLNKEINTSIFQNTQAGKTEFIKNIRESISRGLIGGNRNDYMSSLSKNSNENEYINECFEMINQRILFLTENNLELEKLPEFIKDKFKECKEENGVRHIVGFEKEKLKNYLNFYNYVDSCIKKGIAIKDDYELFNKENIDETLENIEVYEEELKDRKILLDEADRVCNGLDEKSQEEILKIIEELFKSIKEKVNEDEFLKQIDQIAGINY